MPVFSRAPQNVIPLQINLPVQPNQQPVNLPAPVTPQSDQEQQPVKVPKASKAPTQRSFVLPFAGQ